MRAWGPAAGSGKDQPFGWVGRGQALTDTLIDRSNEYQQVKEAEEFAEQDKKEKERVDARNHLESLIFQVCMDAYVYYMLVC